MGSKSIFFSWSAPDAAGAIKLRDRLRASGLEVWEYQLEMAVGDEIVAEVTRRINEARIALICLSDETAGREWIVSEVAWCRDALTKNARHEEGLKYIAPVWVGPHPQNLRPSLLNGFSIADFSSGTDARLQELVAQIREKLGPGGAPEVVPAAIFAMTIAQCRELFADWLRAVGKEHLERLCGILGMGSPPELLQQLTSRYGERAEDLAPFQPGRRLIDLVYETQDQINRQRRAERLTPRILYFMQDELFREGGGSQENEARDLWVSAESVAIVDSISCYHSEISTAILQMPSTERTTFLWLPPYTQRTADLEAPLDETLRLIRRFSDPLRRKTGPPRVSFDATTPLSLSLWLQRSLATFNNQLLPQHDNVSEMKSESPGFSLGRALEARE